MVFRFSVPTNPRSFSFESGNLSLDSEELKQLTRVNTDNLAATAIVRDRALRTAFINKRISRLAREQSKTSLIFCTLIFVLVFAGLITTGPVGVTLTDWILLYLETTFRSVLIATMCFCLFDMSLLIFYRFKLAGYLKNPRFQTLRDLLSEIDRYNQVVADLTANLSALEQLREAGTPVKVQNKTELLAAVKSMRQDLVRALKIERIFRQNPQINPERIDINFTPIKALQLNDRAIDYTLEVNTLLDIGLKVQNEIDALNPEYPTFPESDRDNPL